VDSDDHKTIEGHPANILGDQVEVELSCPSGKTLCNPVVFGVYNVPSVEDLGGPYDLMTRGDDKETADWKNVREKVKKAVKPVCVDAGDKRNISRECYYESQKQHASADPKNNDNLWINFKAGFDDLCGEKGVSENKYYKDRPRAAQDMKDTCAWIQHQLDRGATNANRRQSYSPERDFNQADKKANEGIR
jgi:hypothetical protein